MVRDFGGIAPHFCGRCRRTGTSDGRLCAHCGDELQPEGYCPVCEDWTLAGPGHLCPKHDVELTEGPDGFDLDPADARLVTVATFGLPSEAHGPRLRLEAEGIPAFLQGQRMGDLYHVATGGVRLQVPESFAADARVLLAQTWAAPKSVDEEEDDPWEGLGPDPAERRRSVMKGLILVLLFGPLVVCGLGLLLSSLGR